MMPFFFFRLTINCEVKEPFVAAHRLFVFPSLTVNYSDIFSKPSRYVPLQFFAALLTSRPRVLNVTGTGELIKDEDDDDDDDDAGSWPIRCALPRQRRKPRRAASTAHSPLRLCNLSVAQLLIAMARAPSPSLTSESSSGSDYCVRARPVRSSAQSRSSVLNKWGIKS